ncbi:MAG: glycosyltransferase family 39 protein [bacterium]
MILKKTSKIYAGWEYFVPALYFVSATLSCAIVSFKKYFWNDEFFSYYQLSDPSFRHMMVAFSDKLNITPPLYFILGWVWVQMVGATELSLRIFSSLGLSMAFFIVWITLRRHYGFLAASLGALIAFCFSSLVVYQNAEARMYGLFLLLCSLALLQYDVINKSSKPSVGMILINGVVHAGIVSTHLYGIFYSGAILVAFVLRDRFFKKVRPKVYLVILLSWASAIPYLPAFIQQSDSGRPRSWIPVPRIFELLFSYGLTEDSIVQVILFFVLIIFCLGILLQDKKNRPAYASSFEARISLFIFALAILAVPIFAWTISLVVKPIFLNRYLIPGVLGWAILVAQAFSWLEGYFQKSSQVWRGTLLNFGQKFLSFGLPLLFVALMSSQVIRAVDQVKEPRPGSGDQMYGYADLAIVVSFSHDFLKRYHYATDRGRYFFVLDWQSALDVASGVFSPNEYKNMDALSRNYSNIFQNHIVQVGDFLKNNPRFLLLDDLDFDRECSAEDFHCPRWFEVRVKNNPDYRVTPLGALEGRQLLLVEAVQKNEN